MYDKKNKIKLTDISVVKNLLHKVGVTPSRANGQNFLINEDIISAALKALEKSPRTITELGAGLGVLTLALLEEGFDVKAIEQDDNLVKILPQIVSENLSKKLHIFHGDMRTIPWSWDQPYALIGNVPYNLSGFIFRRLTTLLPQPSLAIFLVQKEVALRLVSNPPHMNLLSLAITLWGQAHIIAEAPPHFFWPAPKVTSSLVQITPHVKPLTSAEEQEQIMTLARHLFQGKRKQIGKRLQEITNISSIDNFLAPIGIKPTMRPQELSVTNWIDLSKKIQGI